MYGVCVFDDPNNRVLKDHFFTSPEMTIEMCLAVCRDKGLRYSGLQWQIECHCGNEPAQGFQWAWFDKCNNKCAGNSNQVCGGSHAMSVYTTRGDHDNDIGIKKSICRISDAAALVLLKSSIMSHNQFIFLLQ